MNLTCWTTLSGTNPAVFSSEDVPQPWRLPEAANVIPLTADPGNFAACVNAAVRQAGSGLLVTLPPDLTELEPDWRERLVRAATNEPDGRFFYGDYYVQSSRGTHLQTVRRDLGDITEREDWGPIWAVRVEWLKAAGGLDECNHRAAFYDLLLKSWGSKRRIHVGGALGTIAAAATDSAADELKRKLFFPGRGKLGGFSYLFMDPEDERHTENVFYRFLRQEGVWLEGERTAIPPSPATTTPLVSVVTPVCDRERYIGKAIESVQRQIFSDWEYLIVDNGSTDRTRDVVRSYARDDSRIRLIENHRNIIALSLNIGVRAARGKYLAQLDSDDEYLPHTLELMVAALEANPTWAVAISYYDLMDENSNVLPEFGIIKHLEYNRNNILRVDGAGALRCWHRAVILEFGGFDEQELGQYGEDYDLVLKTGEKYEVGRVHEVCYHYRRHPDNTDVKRDPEMKIRNKTLARLNALARRKTMSGRG